MTNRRVRLLDRLDFEINVFDARWNLRFRQLAAYQKQHGHCRVPRRSKEYPVLSRWVGTQRQAYINYQQQQQLQHLSGTAGTEASNKNKKQPSISGPVLTLHRMQRLISIGFDWDPHETAWKQHYQELVAFVKQHGHVKIPEGSSLSEWLNNQRRAYHHQQQEDDNHGRTTTTTILPTKNVAVIRPITPERIRLLEQVTGFEWNPWDAWPKRYQELVGYHATHGHCLVPHVYPLGEWVAMQRKAYKRWVAMQRKAYKRHVSSQKDDSPTTFSTAARRGTKRGEMTPERIELLNQIDFFHRIGRGNLKKKMQQQQQALPNKTKAPEQPHLHKKEEEE